MLSSSARQCAEAPADARAAPRAALVARKAAERLGGGQRGVDARIEGDGGRGLQRAAAGGRLGQAHEGGRRCRGSVRRDTAPQLPQAPDLLHHLEPEEVVEQPAALLPLAFSPPLPRRRRRRGALRRGDR